MAMFLITILVLLSISGSVLTAESNSVDHRGRSFLLTFLQTYSFNAGILVTITAQEESNISISMPYLNMTSYFAMQPLTSLQVPLDHRLRISSDQRVEKKAILITATSDVSVYGFSRTHYADGFLGIPVRALSTKYIAATYRLYISSYPAQIGVAASEDDTTVTIQLKLTGVVETRCGGTDYKIGHVFAFSLNAHDVVRLACNQDLTGSVVTSIKPVAVFSGVVNTYIPSSYSNELLEMLVPTSVFGTTFVTTGLLGYATGAIYRIVAEQKDTVVTYSDGWTTTLQAQEYTEKNVAFNESSCLKSNKPVLVVCFAQSEYASTILQYRRPFMMIVPPTERYASEYIIDTNMLYITSLTYPYLIATVPEDVTFRNDIVKNFTSIDTCNVTVASVQVSKGTISLLDSSDGSFGVLHYGFWNNGAYGFPAGYRLDVCPLGLYDENCSSTCDTCEGQVCRATDGLCERGCVAGYRGDYCDKSKTFNISRQFLFDSILSQPI